MHIRDRYSPEPLSVVYVSLAVKPGDLSDGRSTIHRRHNTGYAANCVWEHNRFCGGSVTLWAGVHHDGRTAVMIVNGALNVPG